MKKRYIFIIIFLIILVVFVKKNNNKIIKYKIKNGNEIYSITEKNNKDYYYYNIVWNKKEFPINIFGNKKKRAINKIFSFKDETYTCLLPLFDSVVLTDMKCYDGDIIYNYQTIKGSNKKLDDYVATIKDYNAFNIKEIKENKYNNIISFYDDADKKISVSTYKGIINNKKEIKIFDKDVYSNKISIYVDKYYITADYNSNYEFDKFYIVDLNNNEVSTLKVKNPISFDSYIQGIVENKVYIYDPENEIQYEIIPKNKKISITSNDNIKYYKNNKWAKLSVKQAKKEIYFDYSSIDNIYNEYKKVYENSYYFYVIENEKLYRINKNNRVKEFIINISTDNININNDYLYYIDNGSLYYYSDITGLKLVLTNKEFEFNKYIKTYIY